MNGGGNWNNWQKDSRIEIFTTSIEYKDVAAFSVLIVVLIFFPTGFLGKPDIEKV